MSTLAELMDAEQPAPAQNAPAKKGGQLTKEAMLGYNDLAERLRQFQSVTKDIKPGTDTYQRNMADIAEAQRTLQQAGQPISAAATPKTGTLADFMAADERTPAPQTQAVIGGSGRGVQGGPTAEELQAYQAKPQGIVAQAFQRALQLKQRAPGEIASALDVVAGLPSQAAGTAGYFAGRAFGLTDEEAKAASQPVSQALANPVGRLTNTVGTPGYETSLPTQALQAVGGVLSKGAQTVGERTGISPTDIEQGISAAMMAMPFAPKLIKTAGKKIGVSLPEYTVQPSPGTAAAVGERINPTVPETAPVSTAPAGSVGAAAATTDPYAGKISGEELVRGNFPQIKLSKTPQDAALPEQSTRAQIANEVLGNSGQVRPGVVTGNENTLRNEYTLANMPNPTPEGQVYKQQIANEQIALSNYAKDRVDATGANPSLINDEQRGRTVNDVFYGNHPDDPVPTSITGYFQRAKEKIYKSAKDKYGDNPITTSHVNNLLSDPQWTAGLEIKGVQGVASSAQKLIDLAKNVGFKDANGTMQPAGSVGAYDAVRKALNAEWTPANSRAIGAINGAIDMDIASAADPKLYKLGDNIHKLEKTIFESKGINSLFGEQDRNGVTVSSTPLEKILPKLNNLPQDQWRHVRDTLDQFANGNLRNAPEGMPAIPKELQTAAQSAKNEIDGALARQVYESGAAKAGTWNQNSVNNTLNSTVGQKILGHFPADEVAKFHALNRAGYLMPGVHQYEGAGLQGQRVKGIIEGNVEKTGTALGGALGGFVTGGSPMGVGAGAYIGKQTGAKLASTMEQKALQKAAIKAQEKMKQTSKLGTSLNDIKNLGSK